MRAVTQEYDASDGLYGVYSIVAPLARGGTGGNEQRDHDPASCSHAQLLQLAPASATPVGDGATVVRARAASRPHPDVEAPESRS